MLDISDNNDNGCDVENCEDTSATMVEPEVGQI